MIETRIGPAPRIEKRADGVEVIRGVAPVYYRADDSGTEYRLWGDLYERVRPGAAKAAAAAGVDVRSFFNHDPSVVLGRTVAGTLALRETTAGLEYEVVPPDTTAARDVLESIRRGDVTGSSHMYRVLRSTWEEVHIDGRDVEIRWLEDLEIIEVGPVTLPAYAAAPSSIGRRADDDLAEVRADYDRWQASRAKADRDALDRYRRRARLVDLVRPE